MSPMKVLANLIIFLGTFQGDALEPGEIGDFCKWEPFEAKCRPEEAIIMLGARYGRMKLGRCVKQDLGELGCHADVTELMDDICSGRQSCSVVVPNPDLDRHKTCSSELTSYLEASYTCKRVILGDIARCRSNSPMPVSSSHGVLLSRTTYETGCGSISSPWLLRADPGQKFNISLWNFDRKHLIRYPKSCLKVALISDGEDGEPSVICVMTQVRHQNVFVSKKHSLLLRLAPFTNQQTKTPNNFLFEFQAIGCANMPPPETGAWTRRVGQVTSIGCYENNDVLWNVECVGTKWVGTVGRCDAAKTNFTSSSRMDNLKLTSVMSLLIIISISFLIGLVVLIGGLFWMQRKRRLMRRRSSLQETAYFNKSGENKTVIGKSISQAGTQGVELYSKKHLTSQHFPPSFPMTFDPAGVCSAYSVDSVDLINSALNSTCTVHSSYNADDRELCDPALCRYHCGLDNVVGGPGCETRLKFSVNRNELNEYDSINDSHKADIVAQKQQQQQQQQQQFVSTSSKKNSEVEGHSAKDGEGCASMAPFSSQIKQADTEIFRQHM